VKRKILFLIIILAVAFSAGVALKTKAGVGDSGSGWLWGGSEEAPDGAINGNETGVGWISMNSTNCDTNNSGAIDASDTGPAGCPPIGTIVADYGVNIPVGGGNVSGYAWNENLGWIDFNPAGPYPTVATGDDYPFSVQRSGNELRGWARIIGIQTELAAGNSGNWEGWIRMHSDPDDAVSFGVDVTKMDGTGANPTRAWSDELGWIDFSRASIIAPKTLKICEDSCASGFVRDGTNISMIAGDTKDLVACYTSTACLDPAPGVANNVTNTAAWTETNAPDDAVSLAALAPNLQRVTADNAGKSEQVDVDYDPGTGNINVNFTVDVANNILKVCYGGCVGGTKIDGGILNMEVGDTENLNACYGPQAGCTGGADVTNNASTTWNDTNVPADSVSFSAKGVIDANNIGIETVDVSYDPGTGDIGVNFNANVTGPVGSNWQEVAP